MRLITKVQRGGTEPVLVDAIDNDIILKFGAGTDKTKLGREAPSGDTLKVVLTRNNNGVTAKFKAKSIVRANQYWPSLVA